MGRFTSTWAFTFRAVYLGRYPLSISLMKLIDPLSPGKEIYFVHLRGNLFLTLKNALCSVVRPKLEHEKSVQLKAPSRVSSWEKWNPYRGELFVSLQMSMGVSALLPTWQFLLSHLSLLCVRKLPTYAYFIKFIAIIFIFTVCLFRARLTYQQRWITMKKSVFLKRELISLRSYLYLKRLESGILLPLTVSPCETLQCSGRHSLCICIVTDRVLRQFSWFRWLMLCIMGWTHVFRGCVSL